MFHPCGKDTPNCRDIYTSLDAANYRRSFFFLTGFIPAPGCHCHVNAGALLEYAPYEVPEPESVDRRFLSVRLRNSSRSVKKLNLVFKLSKNRSVHSLKYIF